MTKKIETTVIGSYPTNINNFEFIKNFYNSKITSWNKNIKNAVNDMINAGIDIISDGQTRDPFVNIYYRKIKGIRIRNRPEIIKKIEYDGEITVEDQKYVKKIIPKKTKLIGLIAGPYTLSRSCVDMYYKDEQKLAFDFAKILQKEAKILEKHVDMISIDEPFFSVDYPDYAEELVKIVTKNISCKIRMHICGDVGKIIPKILNLPVDILSHEFKIRPKLFDEFKNYSVDKEICLGSVRSDIKKIEPVEEIFDHIKKGMDIFNGKISQIAPDCGLRTLPQKNAFQKLTNLVKAGEKINV